jgi:hypothetical protein
MEHNTEKPHLIKTTNIDHAASPTPLVFMSEEFGSDFLMMIKLGIALPERMQVSIENHQNGYLFLQGVVWIGQGME